MQMINQECWEICCWNMSQHSLKEFLIKTSKENQTLFPTLFKQKLGVLIERSECQKCLKYVEFFDLETIKFCISQTLICPDKYTTEILQAVYKALTLSVYFDEQDQAVQKKLNIKDINQELNRQKVEEFFSKIDIYLRTVRKIKIDPFEPDPYLFVVEYNEEFKKNKNRHFLDIFIPVDRQAHEIDIENFDHCQYANKAYAQRVLDYVLTEQQIDIYLQKELIDQYIQLQMAITEKRLIDEYFKVEDIDNAGQFFKRVSRIKAKSKSGEVDMELDVNVDIYPMEKGGEYRVSIVRSLGDYQMDQGKYKPEFAQMKTEMDKFQYAMYGRVFKILKDQNKMISVFVSFGGLILKLSGKSEELDKFQDDNKVYLLMRKG